MGSPPADRRSESRKLVDEYEQTIKSVKQQHQVADQVLGRRRRFRRAAILTVALAIPAYLAFMPPAWVKPKPVPPPTPAVRSASDRFAIYLQAQRIESFRNAKGRLPSTMDEAGEPIPGIGYQPYSDGSYALTSDRDRAIRYSSHDSLGAFLGQSLTLLDGDQ